MPIPHIKTEEYDRLFCMYGKKYRLPKLFIKAVAICESALDERAYRYEHQFWLTYLANNDTWKDREPTEVSASYGLMQPLYVVAVERGFSGTPEELYNPVYNVEIGAKILRRNINIVHRRNYQSKYSDYEIACAKYNGGGGGNPDKSGNIRNLKYAMKVMRVFSELKAKEKDCD